MGHWHDHSSPAFLTSNNSGRRQQWTYLVPLVFIKINMNASFFTTERYRVVATVMHDSIQMEFSRGLQRTVSRNPVSPANWSGSLQNQPNCWGQQLTPWWSLKLILKYWLAHHSGVSNNSDRYSRTINIFLFIFNSFLTISKMSIFLHQLKLLNVTDQDRVANSF
jgi:hypothetical protein